MTSRRKAASTIIVGIIAVAFILGGLSMASILAIVAAPPPSQHRPIQIELKDITCYTNPSYTEENDGWERMLDADRARISRMAGKGAIEVQELPSLVCYDYREGYGMERVVVNQMWWRQK